MQQTWLPGVIHPCLQVSVLCYKGILGSSCHLASLFLLLAWLMLELMIYLPNPHTAARRIFAGVYIKLKAVWVLHVKHCSVHSTLFRNLFSTLSLQNNCAIAFGNSLGLAFSMPVALTWCHYRLRPYHKLYLHLRSGKCWVRGNAGTCSAFYCFSWTWIFSVLALTPINITWLVMYNGLEKVISVMSRMLLYMDWQPGCTPFYSEL